MFVELSNHTVYPKKTFVYENTVQMVRDLRQVNFTCGRSISIYSASVNIIKEH